MDYGGAIFSPSGIATSENAAISHSANLIRQSGTEVGEDVLLVAADYLNRDIWVYLYVADDSKSPMIYAPRPQPSVKFNEIRLAYYVPGHYRYVTASPSSSMTNSTSNVSRDRGYANNANVMSSSSNQLLSQNSTSNLQGN